MIDPLKDFETGAGLLPERFIIDFDDIQAVMPEGGKCEVSARIVYEYDHTPERMERGKWDILQFITKPTTAHD